MTVVCSLVTSNGTCVHVFRHDYCDDYLQILPLTKDTSKTPIGGPLASVEDRRMRSVQGMKGR